MGITKKMVVKKVDRKIEKKSKPQTVTLAVKEYVDLCERADRPKFLTWWRNLWWNLVMLSQRNIDWQQQGIDFNELNKKE
jgi:hypothetical protein